MQKQKCLSLEQVQKMQAQVKAFENNPHANIEDIIDIVIAPLLNMKNIPIPENKAFENFPERAVMRRKLSFMDYPKYRLALGMVWENEKRDIAPHKSFKLYSLQDHLQRHKRCLDSKTPTPTNRRVILPLKSKPASKDPKTI